MPTHTALSVGLDMEYLDVRYVKLPDQPPLDDGYDPRAHRKPLAPIEIYMAYFDIIRVGFGAGLLGMPYAISQLGMIFGCVASVLIGVLIIHLHIVLLWCKNEISRQLKISYISYRYGFRIALLHGPRYFHCIAEWGPSLVASFMILSQIGICTVFVIFCADSVRDIMDYQEYTKGLMYLFVPYLLFMMSIKNLKDVSYISIIGNVTNFFAMFMVYYYFLSEPHGEVVLWHYDPFAFFFGTGSMLFNISSVGVILSLDKHLRHPQVMTTRFGVIPLGMSVTVALSTITGMLGYHYGGTLDETVVRALPYEDTIAMYAMALFLVTISMTYPLQSYPGTQILIEVLKNHKLPYMSRPKFLTALDNASKPIFVLITFVISYFIPFQAPFVAFVGTSCTTILSVVFPCLMNLCLRYPSNYGIYKWILIKDLILVTFGLLWWIIGVFITGHIIKIRLMSMKNLNNEEYL